MVAATTRQTFIGGFVLGGAALALSAFVLFGNARIFSRTDRAVVVFQNSVSGLAVGAPVTFRGVLVGQVTGISLRFDSVSHTAYIPVTLSLDADKVMVVRHGNTEGTLPSLGDMVRSGLRAEENVQSFVTGQTNIELDFFPGSAADLHPQVTDETEIPTHISSVEKVKQALMDMPLKDIAAHADQTMVSLNRLADRLDQSLPLLLESVKSTSDHSRETVDAATAAIRELQQKLSVTLTDVDTLMKTGTTQLDQRGRELHTLLVSAGKTTEDTRRTLDDLHGMLSPRSAERANISAALRDTAAAAAALRGFASDIERDPKLLLMGRRN
ncbi:MlaD family protein [Acetobacter sp. AN02]|uniref:MlaD family protein n=1 Tax=Acetobacter sp. AN02 TaxID=2894186 RepID=UPI0024344F1E|nr:MlaD family protein [Acetobacter sp. AN02]MDG6095725.1 MlaD family protein [Acetobacter sp. AN02]